MYLITCTEEKFLISNHFNFTFPHHYQGYTQLNQTQFESCVCHQDVLIVNELRVTEKVYQNNPNLKLIALCSTGYEHIDLSLAEKYGVKVCNIRGYATQSVAEHAFMLLLSLFKNFSFYQQAAHQGTWSKSHDFCYLDAHFPIYELNQKTLVIFGQGEIGQSFAQKAHAFGMRILYAERPSASTIRAGYTEFWHAITQADVLSLHGQLSESTQNCINAQVLQQMKIGSFLLNVSRGGLIDEQAVVEALEKKHLAGYAADVMTQEPPFITHSFLQPHLNVVLTPHVAWGSVEAQQRLFDILTQNIHLNLQGQNANLLSQAS